MKVNKNAPIFDGQQDGMSAVHWSNEPIRLRYAKDILCAFITDSPYCSDRDQEDLIEGSFELADALIEHHNQTVGDK